MSSSTPLPQPSRDCPPTGLRATGLRAGRIAVEVLLGTVLGAATGAGGAYVGLLGDVAAGREAGAGLGIGAAAGVMLGVAPGVWLGGYAMGGDGAFGWSFLGSAVGTGLSAGLLAIDATPPTLVVSMLLPVAGAVVGYELSSNTRRAPRAAAAPRVAPWMGARGIGLAGTF